MSDEIQPTFEHRPDRSRYEARVGERVAGFAEYRTRADGVTVFTHTEVADAFEGHGIASRLIRFALDDVRDHDGAIVARCPFVAEFVREHPAYADLLA